MDLPTLLAASQVSTSMPLPSALAFRSASFNALSNSEMLTSPVLSLSKPFRIMSKSSSEGSKQRRVRPVRSSSGETMPFPLESMTRKTSIIRVLLLFRMPFSLHKTSSMRSMGGSGSCLRGVGSARCFLGVEVWVRLFGEPAVRGKVTPPGEEALPTLRALSCAAFSARSNSLRLMSPLLSLSSRPTRRMKSSSGGSQPSAESPLLNSSFEMRPSPLLSIFRKRSMALVLLSSSLAWTLRSTSSGVASVIESAPQPHRPGP
mmetsp:Transcript_46797/g.102236  ORF Transcript_46797/g.102236 Transcript_46797/m.102236 type:complete len:261 (-) Transcript_46797:57-839(-)